MSCTYRLIHTDDSRFGPELCAQLLSEEEEEEEEQDDTCIVNIEMIENYIVYHVYIDTGDGRLTALARWETLKEAERFAMEQYYLYTGDYPFIVTGEGRNYHPTGKREPFPLQDEDAECLVPLTQDSDGYEHLLIAFRGEVVQTHSLNSFAIW